MTDEQARKVLKILLEADGGCCSTCSSDLFRIFVAEFPEFEHTADEVWSEYWDEDSSYKERN